MGVSRRRRNPSTFLKCSSNELERQLRELIAGQVEELPKPPLGIRRAIIAVPESIGERRFCMQLGDALTEFGYEWCLCPKEVACMAEKMNVDLFISSWTTIPPPNPASGIVSMLYIHSPFCISPKSYKYINAYDNFLFAQSGTDKLEEYLHEIGKNFRHLETYFTLRKTHFCASPKKRIAFVGNLWDSRRRDKLAQLFHLLDETGYCDFYGPASGWQRKNFKSWKGAIPLHGLRDVQDVMEAAGIALLLHHRQQFEAGSAVYRDFEALSASCAIITEKTDFMQKYFGDCVLFIDTNKPAKEIFEQIDAHMQWILAHPEDAIEMARKAHQIFCDNFSLESECEKILSFAKSCAKSSA
jgi:glycosyltransferase involved in cell wall biosynthesis